MGSLQGLSPRCLGSTLPGGRARVLGFPHPESLSPHRTVGSEPTSLGAWPSPPAVSPPRRACPFLARAVAPPLLLLSLGRGWGLVPRGSGTPVWCPDSSGHSTPSPSVPEPGPSPAAGHRAARARPRRPSTRPGRPLASPGPAPGNTGSVRGSAVSCPHTAGHQGPVGSHAGGLAPVWGLALLAASRPVGAGGGGPWPAWLSAQAGPRWAHAKAVTVAERLQEPKCLDPRRAGGRAV